MRHAKAEQTAETDTARGLTERGAADAAEAGRWIAAQGLTPDHVLVSSARRTRETWAAVAGAAGWQVAAEHDDGLYAAGPDTALDLVRESPAGARVVLVIGHNPTMAYLAQLLDDGEGDPSVAVEAAGGYPTSALTVLAHDGAWCDLATGSATAVAFHVGRA